MRTGYHALRMTRDECPAVAAPCPPVRPPIRPPDRVPAPRRPARHPQAPAQVAPSHNRLIAPGAIAAAAPRRRDPLPGSANGQAAHIAGGTS